MSQPSLTDTARTGTASGPGVKVPPPVVFALALLASWGAQTALRLPRMPSATALGIGLPVIIIALAFAATSVATMLRGRGTLNTNIGPRALVTSGIYRVTRNPMYVAVALLYSGAALALNIPWALLCLPLLVIYTQRMVIAREEAYLASAFGQEYLSYKARVRRWI